MSAYRTIVIGCVVSIGSFAIAYMTIHTAPAVTLVAGLIGTVSALVSSGYLVYLVGTYLGAWIRRNHG
ncbi:MAG: hypothetical protein WC525_08945 [Candidatus Thermoplasmatota archaeon]